MTIGPHGEDLRVWLPLLEDLAPFAPRAVEAELSKLEVHPRLLLPHKRAVKSARERVARLEASPPESAACAFPVVTEGDAWLDGAVLHALATAEQVPGACPADKAFPGEPALLDLLAASEARAFVVPSPLGSSTRLCELVGDSCGAAFALALEAARRGVAIPRDAVVSAAVATTVDGLVLRSVGGCDRKRLVLERERPGCRFFYVPQPGEQVRPSSVIELVPIAAGTSFRVLARMLLPRQTFPRAEEILREVREAEDLFSAQRYDEALPRWERILSSLETTELAQAAHWTITALTRLGAIDLHAGRPDDAAQRFDRAAALAATTPGAPRLAVDSVRVYVAGTLIDRFRPHEAAGILKAPTREWRRRLAADDEGLDRREMLIACLGATRRLRLLLGDADGAVESQRELVGWAPVSEQARALADLGECLRRSGRPGQAREAFGASRQALDSIPLEVYRLQTEAFLSYYEGRLALDTGAAGPDGAYLEGLEQALPRRSAAGWRLRELALLCRLRAGDAGAAAALLLQVDRAEGDFARWNALLGLLRGAAVAPPERDRLHVAAAEGFVAAGELAAGYPELDQARRRFCERFAAERERQAAAAQLLHRSAY